MAYLSSKTLLAAVRPDHETPVEITGLSMRQQITAMRVGYGGDGGKELVYLGEQGPLDWLLLPRAIEDGQGRQHGWWRFEVSTDSKDLPIEAGDELIVADYPYAGLRVHQAAFKKGSAHGKPDLSALGFDSVEDIQDWLDRLKHDYFYSKKGVIAAISKPGGVLDPDGQRNAPMSEVGIIFGVCEDVAAFERIVLESKAVKELLRVTKKKIRLGPKEYYPDPIELPREVIDESNSLMYLAVRQALAGPYADGSQWVNKPVTDLVNRIYRDHLFNCWKRYQNDQGRRSDRDPDD